MKILFTLIFVLAMSLFAVGKTAEAAPFNPNFVNPNVVAFYPEGNHTIVPNGYDYFGMDLVMVRGYSGNFHQWFYGTFPDGRTGGIHSVWNVTNDLACSNGWILVENAYENGWGDYMTPGVDFCVHNNYFHVSK